MRLRQLTGKIGFDGSLTIERDGSHEYSSSVGQTVSCMNVRLATFHLVRYNVNGSSRKGYGRAVLAST